jgi:hypothetical protein
MNKKELNNLSYLKANLIEVAKMTMANRDKEQILAWLKEMIDYIDKYIKEEM